MNSVMTAGTKIQKLQEAITAGYRPLQALLKDLRDAKLVTLQIKALNVKFEVLKTEALRLIAGYQPIAATQDAIATNEQKEQKVLASIPSGTVTNNCDFSSRLLHGTTDEKIWLVKKDINGAGLTFVLSQCGRYYETFAGDALRAIALLGMPTQLQIGALKAQVRTHYAQRLQQDAKAIGLTLHLYDRE